jgi:hypothetical protein
MSLADPSELPCFAEDGTILNVIIETPKGSRNKFAYDEKRKIFKLTKVLPVGMAFPYDFGFVPSTKAEDGDPTDVLVLMDEPASDVDSETVVAFLLHAFLIERSPGARAPRLPWGSALWFWKPRTNPWCLK